MVDDFTLVLKQQQLYELEEISKQFNAVPDFHIYFIVRRPRIYFDHESIELTKNHLKGKCKIQDRDSFKTIEFNYIHYFKEKNLAIECVYPYDKMFVVTEDQTKIFGGYASLMLQEFNTTGNIITGAYTDESEVIYIGQSFGQEGSRTAEDRLLSHSTLQKIYSENTPDKEIWITLWSFTRNELMFMSPKVDNQENHELFMKFFNYTRTRYEKISFEQEINFTEAALIRYFQPIYNDKFKYNFPSKAHTTYSQCYKLGLDYVAFEIDTKRLNMIIWSEAQPLKKFKHKEIYSLKNKDDIKKFFGLE